MKTKSSLIISLVLILSGVSILNCNAQLPAEKPLWPNGIPGNPVKYKEEKLRTELHVYFKGGHGFDSGLERGYAISTWRDSFIAWLKDTGFIKE